MSRWSPLRPERLHDGRVLCRHTGGRGGGMDMQRGWTSEGDHLLFTEANVHQQMVHTDHRLRIDDRRQRTDIMMQLALRGDMDMPSIIF